MPEPVSRDKLYWRCRRGMLELDLLLQGFLKGQYDDLPASGKKAFEVLLEYPDAVLFDLLMGKSTTADGELASVIKKIRATSAN